MVVEDDPMTRNEKVRNHRYMALMEGAFEKTSTAGELSGRRWGWGFRDSETERKGKHDEDVYVVSFPSLGCVRASRHKPSVLAFHEVVDTGRSEEFNDVQSTLASGTNIRLLPGSLIDALERQVTCCQATSEMFLRVSPELSTSATVVSLTQR